MKNFLEESNSSLASDASNELADCVDLNVIYRQFINAISF